MIFGLHELETRNLIQETEKKDSIFYDKAYSLNYYKSEKNRAEKYVDELINQDIDLNNSASKLIKPLDLFLRSINNKQPYINDDTSTDKFGSPGKFRFINNQQHGLWKAVQNTVKYFYFHDRGENIRFKNIHPNLKIISNNFWKTFLDKDSVLHSNPYDYNLGEHIDIWAKITKIVISEDCAEWLKEKLYYSIKVIPKEIIMAGGFGKVLRTIGGVMLFSISSLPKNINEEEIRSTVFRSIKAGYYFGMMYPLIDDLLDSKTVLNEADKIRFNNCISDFVSGNLNIDKNQLDIPHIKKVRECFQGLIDSLPVNIVKEAFNALHMLYLSQKEDGIKSFKNIYSDKDIYIPIIIKAAYTGIIAGLLAEIDINEDFTERVFSQGLEMQLVDDFRDYPHDLYHGQFTPFTYYASRENNKKMANPMLVFLGSLSKTIENHDNNKRVKYMLAKRFGHGIKKHVLKNGNDSLDDFFTMFPLGSKKLELIIQSIANNKDKINNLSVIIVPVISNLIKREFEV